MLQISICEPASATSSLSSVRIAARVATGIKAGVSMSPCGVEITPRRARLFLDFFRILNLNIQIRIRHKRPICYWVAVGAKLSVPTRLARLLQVRVCNEVASQALYRSDLYVTSRDVPRTCLRYRKFCSHVLLPPSGPRRNYFHSEDLFEARPSSWKLLQALYKAYEFR